MSDDMDTGELMEVIDEGAVPVDLPSDTEDFAQQIADSVASFLLALREIAREGDAGRAVEIDETVHDAAGVRVRAIDPGRGQNRVGVGTGLVEARGVVRSCDREGVHDGARSLVRELRV